MPQLLALSVYIFIVLVLFIKDRKLRPMTSGALWIVLLWITIIGPRSISSWLGVEIDIQSPDDFLEGTPLDRNLFLLLIITGSVALFRRRPDWREIFHSNRWFFAFIIYCGISIIWSDYPFTSFKRWIKELGNIIMVLIILTEEDPVQAIRAVFSRYVYIVVPLSVVLIYFFPDLGTYPETDTMETVYFYCGVATHKNLFGTILFVSGLFLVWDLAYMRGSDEKRTDTADVLSHYALLMMVVWLLHIANSASALVSLILGISILLLAKVPILRNRVRYVGTIGLVICFLILIIYSVPGILETFFTFVGREASFTGRTDLWADVLRESFNPILGTGYQSFWLGDRLQHIWDAYYWHPLQAHNGYLETYLNGGLIGLCLLVGTIISTGSKLKVVLLNERSLGILLFAVLITTVFRSWTEALFSGLNILWFVLSIAALCYVPSSEYGEES